MPIPCPAAALALATAIAAWTAVPLRAQETHPDGMVVNGPAVFNLTTLGVGNATFPGRIQGSRALTCPVAPT